MGTGDKRMVQQLKDQLTASQRTIQTQQAEIEVMRKGGGHAGPNEDLLRKLQQKDLDLRQMQSRMDEIEARYHAKEEMFSVNKNRFDELATELREQKAQVQNL